MKTIAEVLRLSTEFLREVPRSRRIAEELLSAACRMGRMQLYLQFDRPVVEEELSALREWLKRCARGEPLEYVIGEVEFYHCRIAVDARVLIPRPETEILVDRIVKVCAQLKNRHLWDLCTGSGCIGIALKKALPLLHVTLSDLCPEALALSASNAEKNDVQVDFVLGDLLEPFCEKKADVVVCNPPYVSTTEYFNLQPSVREFEPKRALVGGAQGMDFYERLALDLPSRLNSGGLVFLEIGKDQGDLLKALFSKGPWARIALEKDWAGHDRFFFLEKQ